MAIYSCKTLTNFSGQENRKIRGVGEGAEMSSQTSLQKAGHQLHFRCPRQHHLKSGTQHQTHGSLQYPVKLNLWLELSNSWQTGRHQSVHVANPYYPIQPEEI